MIDACMRVSVLKKTFQGHCIRWVLFLFVCMGWSECAYSESHDEGGGGESHGGASAARGAKSAHGGAPEKVVPTPFLKVGPFNLCIIKNYEVKGYIRLTIDLLCKNERAAEHLAVWVPRLQNQYIIDFSQILSQFWIEGTPLDLSRVKVILQRITDRLMGKGVIRDVFVETYFFADPKESEEDKTDGKQALNKLGAKPSA